MEYDEFCHFLKHELPLNRKERFYTGTILPMLLFHKGLNNFYTFLRAIKDFPPEINEAETKDNFLFYTEYNLKESAGDRNVGRRIVADTKDTPDVIVEILKPTRLFIIIEAKMFEKINQSKLNGQVSRQRKYIAEPLKETFQLEDNQIFHIALVPKALRIEDSKYYQVINWEFFIDNRLPNVEGNLFYNYLRFALENYSHLVQKSTWVLPDHAKEDEKMTGEAIYENGKNLANLWVGRRGGRLTFRKDIQTGKWRRRKYFTNLIKPDRGLTGQWISSMDFAEMVDRYSEEA